MARRQFTGESPCDRDQGEASAVDAADVQGRRGPASARHPRGGWTATALCAALLATFAGLSLSAARTKSATIDEPVHVVSGLVQLRLRDYRIDPDNPPLWKCWAALGDVGLPVTFHPQGRVWRDLSWDPVGEATWSARTLFDTPGNDGGALLNRARAMMLVVGVALGVAIAAWAGRLGGPVAAVVATALFALDPNFIAHAPLVKSDVAVALALFLVARVTWGLGRRVTVAGVVCAGLACGAAVNVKLPGLLAGPILGALLLARACAPVDWPLPAGRPARTLGTRLAVAATAAVSAAGVCVVVTWACYGFRYRPSPAPGVRVDLPAITARSRLYAASEALGRVATPGEVAARRPGALDRFVHWADDRRLLPQPMLAGLLYQATNAARWPAFLDGRRYDDGRAAYFPLAALYKTPLATLALAAVVVGLIPLRHRWRGDGVAATSSASPPGAGWAMACVGVPAVLFAVTAIRAHVNIGVRTVLPIYPFLYVALGCAAAWAFRHRPRLTGGALGVALGCLAATAVGAWPDYIPFFNAIAGGKRGGFAHLADSNLDWGQDADALAAWCRDHRGVTVYGDLFVTGDPAWYGIDCRPLWLTDASGHALLNVPRKEPAVLAISATHLRGLYVDPAREPFLDAMARRSPDAVLHGTIYLYDDRP